MTAFVLQQVSSSYARENCARTLDKPVGIRHIVKFLNAATLADLNTTCPDGLVHVWGAKYERSHQFWKMPERNSIVLFRRGRTIFALGVIFATTENEALAESLWRCGDDGETWPLIFFLKRLRPLNVPALEINPLLGRKPNDNWQGLVALTVQDSPELKAFFAAELG